MATVALTACGSSNTTSSSSGGGATPSSVSALQQIQSDLAKLATTTVSMAKPPSGSFNPGSHQVAVVATGLATPGASDLSKIIQEAITKIGWTAPPTYDGKFQPTVQSGLIQTALSSGAQAIILISVTPTAVASALQVAQSKNVPIVCVLCGPPSTYSQFPGIVGVEPSPENVGKAQAEYAIAKTNGTGKIWVYEDSEFLFTAAQNKAAEAFLSSQCTGCTTNVEQMKAGDEQKPGVPVLSGVLSAHPKGTIDYVIAPYDNAAANFATLAANQGRTEIGFLGYAALPVFFNQIKAGTPPGAAATVSIPLPYMAYSAVDETARLLSNTPTWDATQLGVGLVTQSDVSQFSASPYINPDFDFKTTFAQSWGKS